MQRVKYKDIEQIPLRTRKNFKQQFHGSAPAPFIGRFGYPKVNIGVLSPQFIGPMDSYDSPRHWAGNNINIRKIASLRTGLVNSRSSFNVKQIHKGGKFLDICQEVGMAKKAAELEVSLSKPPQISKSDKEIIPFGPASDVHKARVTANVNVDSQVEKVVSDVDLKSATGIIKLYKKGFEENTLTKLISVGNLGLKRKRKLVPTRWSITAVDDTVGKQLINEVKDYPVGEYQTYFGGEWGNYYLILLIPEVWSYELFETYLDQKINPWSKKGYVYSTDHENHHGRKNYAEECAGGYYSARLSITEHLKKLKRQGSVVALRFISPEYNLPLGVWVCREASRKSLSEKPITFASKELMLRYVSLFVKKKFNFDVEVLLKQSKILNNKQSKLDHFLKNNHK